MDKIINLRIDQELKDKATDIAKDKNISLAEMIRRFLILEVSKEVK